MEALYRPGSGRTPVSPYNLFKLLPEPAQLLFLASARPRTFTDGQVIYQQGDLDQGMFLIVSGHVRLSLLYSDGHELVFVTYEPGDCFGFSTLIDGLPLPHTTEALGTVELQCLNRAGFDALRAASRAFDEALLQLLCRYLRVLSAYFASATVEDLSSRLARRLLDAARSTAVLRVSQAELALMAGVSRQTANKLLKEFEKEGLVRLSYGAVVISDRAGLGRRAGSGRDG